MNEKFEKLKYFLDEHGADFLFVSSSNCFLEEFNAQEQNSRFLLTGFKGSSGDALFSKQKTFLFVDPRYHEMASNQVDEEKVFVVKLQMGENFLSYMKKHISSDAKILIVSSKISQKMFETLQKSFAYPEGHRRRPYKDKAYLSLFGNFPPKPFHNRQNSLNYKARRA